MPESWIQDLLYPTARTGGKGKKNDRNDARAICEAAGRPHMRFVPVKNQDQQALNKQDDRVQRIMEIKGAGALTASAIVATVGNASLFKNGRQFAA